jgi:hypothetical protein
MGDAVNLTFWGFLYLGVLSLCAAATVQLIIRALTGPKYKCDCGHSLAYHDNDGCNKQPLGKNGNHCECVRYIGKSPQSEVDELAKKRPWRSQGS